jgi:hypothetical protein
MRIKSQMDLVWLQLWILGGQVTIKHLHDNVGDFFYAITFHHSCIICIHNSKITQGRYSRVVYKKMRMYSFNGNAEHQKNKASILLALFH